MTDSVFTQLLEKYITRSISSSEREQLFSLLRSGTHDTELEAIIGEQWTAGLFDTKEDDQLRQIIFSGIQQKLRQQQSRATVRKMYWKRWAIAASVLLMLGAGYWWWVDRMPEKNIIASVEDVNAPQKSKAVITLANGQKLFLDSAANGTVAIQGNVNVVKLADGQIAYNGRSSPATGHSPLALSYNTLTNPRGSKVINMFLADGSHVWLNAGSSITYPVAFIGNERNVTITGEAYFEVVQDVRKPFIVYKGSTGVRVLGTRFNVNAYDDDDTMKVTLLEGRVKVQPAIPGLKSAILQPGQQAQLSYSTIRLVNPDLDVVMAWKNGWFNFDRQDVQTITRQLACWYDVQFTYDSNIGRETFSGIVSRNSNLSAVLKIMEQAGMKFTIEGKKIYVKP